MTLPEPPRWEDLLMPLQQRPWYPLASGAGWGLLVLALVLVNSGNLVLAALVAAFVALLSWKLAQRQQDARGPGSAEQ